MRIYLSGKLIDLPLFINLFHFSFILDSFCFLLSFFLCFHTSFITENAVQSENVIGQIYDAIILGEKEHHIAFCAGSTAAIASITLAIELKSKSC